MMRCPTCKKTIPESTPPTAWRPFCSERCKLIDFGHWASERHSIPGEPANLFDDPEAVDFNSSDLNDPFSH